MSEKILSDTQGRKLMNENAKPYFLEGGKKDECVLLVHGFTATPWEMRPLAEYISAGENSYPVYSILLPGHGTKMEDLGECLWEDWVCYAGEKLGLLAKEYKKVNIAGFSMGGNIALCLAYEYNVNAVVCICTPVKLKNRLSSIAGIISLFREFVYWEKPHFKQRKITSYDGIGYEGMPVKSVVQVKKLTDETRKNLKNVKCPILVVQSPLDGTVHPKSPHIIFNGVKSRKKDLLFLEEPGHNVLGGPETDKINRAVMEFFNGI